MKKLPFLFLIVTISCGRVDNSDLPGTYAVQYDFGTETLILEHDGSYAQHIEVGDSSVSHSGRWIYSNGNVLLEDALIIDGDFEELNPSWTTPMDGFRVLHTMKWFPWSQFTLVVGETRRFRKISDGSVLPGR